MSAREKRALVTLIRHGDQALDDAITDGMLAGMEIQRQRVPPAWTRHSPDYWEASITLARYRYAARHRMPKALRAAGKILLMLYGSACYAATVAWRAIQRRGSP